MAKEKTEFLILGQGFAGTALALSLMNRGKSVRILASEEKASASSLAVGLVNPVTGRRMAKTWNYEAVVPRAHAFYAAAHFQIHGREGTFLERRPIFKALHSVEEMNFLSGKSASDGYDHLIRIHSGPEVPLPSVFRHTTGWIEIMEGGRLDPVAYLSAARAYFLNSGCLLDELFDMSVLRILPEGYEYQGLLFSNVISALGLNCPWAGPDLWAVKGQVFQFTGFPDWGNAILKTEKFAIPLGRGEVLMGSTYEREFENAQNDAAGFSEVTADLEPETLINIRQVRAWSGIRPTTKDRLPVIKKQAEGLYLVNGMGTKGVSLAPYAAGRLMSMLEADGRL